MEEQLKKAIQIMRDGGIVIFPTDTAFGIGCRIDNEDAIQKLFKLRRRAETKATPVLTASLVMIEPYLSTINDDIVTKLIEPYWPGGLTIVLPCQTEMVSTLIRGGTATLGVRIPNHLVTLDLISGVGVPIIGTSANFSGQPTPFRFEDLDPELTELVDYVLPGTCHGYAASTVIDVTHKPWKILRKGAVEVPEELCK